MEFYLQAFITFHIWNIKRQFKTQTQLSPSILHAANLHNPITINIFLLYQNFEAEINNMASFGSFKHTNKYFPSSKDCCPGPGLN